MNTILSGLLINFISNFVSECFNYITKEDFESNMTEVFIKLENNFRIENPNLVVEDSALARQENVDILCKWIFEDNIFNTVPLNFNLNNFDGTILAIEQKDFIIKELRKLVVENDILKRYIEFNITKDTNNIIRREIEKYTGIKISYFYPNDYIERNVRSFKDKHVSGSLYDICCAKKRVVLLADAGMGKSKELECLTTAVSKLDFYKVYSYDLSTYIDHSIENFIGFDNTYKGQSFIILDGFDEIEAKNVNAFIKRLNRFTNQYKENTVFIISSRKNFYVLSQESIISSFNNFYELELLPIDDKLVEDYIERQIGDRKYFMEAISKSSLEDLIKNPFYLKMLIEIYNKDKILPKKSDLIDKMIDNRFCQDSNKYISTEALYQRKVKINELLQKVAFSLHCLNKQDFDEAEYQILFEYNERCLLQYTGIWRKYNGLNWKFEHNNFKEYLVAKFLSNMELFEIKELITYKEMLDTINPLWMNVLSFLVSIYQKNTLVEWLIDEHPSYVVQFEINTVDYNKRGELIIAILENYNEKNMSINWDVNSSQKLANFGQSKHLLKYLLNQVENFTNIISFNNALRILRFITDFYCYENDIRSIIFEYCKSEKMDSYEKQCLIMILSNSRIYTEKIADELIKLFYENCISDIRYGMYLFIQEHNLQNKYVGFLIKGIEIWHSNKKETINLSEKIYLDKNIPSINSIEAVRYVLNYLINLDENSPFWWEGEEYFDPIIFNAEILYKEGEVKVLNDIQVLFIKSSMRFNQRLVSLIKTFFNNTGTVFDTYAFVLNECKNLDEGIFCIEDIMDKQCIDDFIEIYKNDELEIKRIFIEYALRRNTSDYRFEEIIKLVFEKEGIKIPKREVVDYDLIRKRGKQIYFNALFDEEKYLKLIDDFIKLLMPDGSILENWHSNIKNKPELSDIYYDCYLKENNNSDKLRDFIYAINWEDFSINRIVKKMYNSSKDIEVSKKQEEIIINYCYKKIYETNFESEIELKVNGFSCSNLIKNLLFFTTFYSLDYEEEVYLKMLMIPTTLFNETKNSYRQFSSYLIRRIRHEEMKNQIIFNLRNETLIGDVALQHLNFCKENKLDDGIDLALDIWKDNEYTEYVKGEILEYIMVVKDSNYVYKNLLPTSNTVQLKIIVNKCQSEKNGLLICRMQEENSKSEDGKMYLQELISIDSLFGLKKYYNLAIENNRIPDYPDEEGTIPVITGEISKVKDFESLELVMKLSELVTKNDFIDLDSWGLYNSLCGAIKNIASNGNALKVKIALEKLANASIGREKLATFCYGNIESIRTDLHSQLSSSWSIAEVKSFLEKGVIHMGNNYNITNNGTIQHLAVGDQASVVVNDGLKEELNLLLKELAKLDLPHEEQERINVLNDNIKNNRFGGVKAQINNLIVGISASCIANGMPQLIENLASIVQRLT
ncbi:NACHT domain-containing protein [Aminipila sp.]|uniref:NACHT domain-containing protein n=1 Tax=Aminipila sp. TaxID=2060095 RepID=UPI0028A1CD7C|nr:hypothetical protein [Aminipila sp.]